MKWAIFMIYWITLTATMRQGDLWMWLFLMPTFLMLWQWAEEQDDQEPSLTHRGPAAESGARGPAAKYGENKLERS